jgi:ABC-type xylose transport system permease subunit
VIDIGGGASRLVDVLVKLDMRDVTVLDLSEAALGAAKRRVGDRADHVKWIVADVTKWEPRPVYDIWHDRATFHFLTDEGDRAAYVARLTTAVKPGGHAIVARGGLPLGPAGVAMPNLTLAAIATLFLTWTFLEQTIFGRRVYAFGGNAKAARLAGIPVKRKRCVAFGLSGLGAAGAGLMMSGRGASANPTQGAGLMLDAIAVVFLGTAMSDKGQPRALFTLVGILMIGVLANGLVQMNVNSYVCEMITGSIIIAVGTGSLGRMRMA